MQVHRIDESRKEPAAGRVEPLQNPGRSTQSFQNFSTDTHIYLRRVPNSNKVGIEIFQTFANSNKVGIEIFQIVQGGLDRFKTNCILRFRESKKVPDW